MKSPIATPSRAEERRQTRVLVTIVSVAVGLAVATVVGFNLRSNTLFNSSAPMQKVTGGVAKVRSHAPVPETAPEPASARENSETAVAPTESTSDAKITHTDNVQSGLTPQPAHASGFVPPADDAIPDGPMGDVVRRGE